MAKKSFRKHIHHVDKKLKFRLRLYFVIAIVMFGVVFYDIFKEILIPELAIIGVIIGVVIGIISARMSNITWNKDANKIVSRMDRFGVIFSIFYILFALVRNKLIGFFVHGPVMGAVGFSVAAGVMVGRIIGTRGEILRVLKEEEII